MSSLEHKSYNSRFQTKSLEEFSAIKVSLRNFTNLKIIHSIRNAIPNHTITLSDTNAILAIARRTIEIEGRAVDNLISQLDDDFPKFWNPRVG